MLRLPAAHSAALRFLRLAVPRWRRPVSCAGLPPLPPGRDADPAGPGLAAPVAPFRLVPWRRQDLPGSWGTPGEHARLFDPGGIGRPRPIAARPMRPSVFVTTSAPALDLISGLDGKACPLAVYASQPRLPNGHARLASGPALRSSALRRTSCRPTLPGGIGYPLGPHTRFRAIRYLIAHLLAQAFPGAQQTQPRAGPPRSPVSAPPLRPRRQRRPDTRSLTSLLCEPTPPTCPAKPVGRRRKSRRDEGRKRYAEHERPLTSNLCPLTPPAHPPGRRTPLPLCFLSG